VIHFVLQTNLLTVQLRLIGSERRIDEACFVQLILYAFVICWVDLHFDFVIVEIVIICLVKWILHLLKVWLIHTWMYTRHILYSLMFINRISITLFLILRLSTNIFHLLLSWFAIVNLRYYGIIFYSFIVNWLHFVLGVGAVLLSLGHLLSLRW